MASDKSLAAEIEAVVCSLTCVEQYLIEADFDAAAAAVREASRLLEAQAAEIAALQSRAFEDGARWMRDQAAERAGTVHEWMPEECALEPIEAIWEEIRNLPLQPEGERSDA